MKTTIVFLCLSAVLALASDHPQFLAPLIPKELRAPVDSLARQGFLSATNIQRTIVLPSRQWQLSGLGPGPLIERFKRSFESSDPVIVPTKELDEEVARLPFQLPSQSKWSGAISNDRIRWSDVYFLTRDGGFLSFGEIDKGFIFFTEKTVGVILTKGAEPAGPANGSQPIRSETNRTSSAAGSRR